MTETSTPPAPTKNVPWDSTEQWYEVGTKVHTLRLGDDNIAPEVRVARVQSISAREVVLDDEQRFPRATLRRQSDGFWGPTVGMVPFDSEVVRQAQHRAEHRQKMTNAKARCVQFLADTPGLSAADVIMALAPLTGVKDEIWDLFQAPHRHGRKP